MTAGAGVSLLWLPLGAGGHVVRWNGRAYEAVAALLDPEAIVVGGGTAQAGEDLLDPVRERLVREAAVPPILIASALGPEAQLYGAVYAALQLL